MYLRKQEGITQIPADYKQTFANKFTLNIGKNEIVKMKANNVLTERDVEVAKFLFNFTFATLEQIHAFLKEDNSVQSLKVRLDKLVKYRILNKFMLGQFQDESIQPEAFEIYCLDLGGRYLLAHYSNEDTTDWYSTVNMKTSEIVSRSILTTDFYLRLRDTVGDRLLHFKVEPELRVAKTNVIPSFEFCMQDSMRKRYFVGEVVREYDFPIHFREKAAKLEHLLATNAWKKYYYDSDSEPVLFVFADTDRTALDAGRLLTETTELNRFRISTDERIHRELYETGAFLKFDEEENVLREIKATTFQP